VNATNAGRARQVCCPQGDADHEQNKRDQRGRLTRWLPMPTYITRLDIRRVIDGITAAARDGLSTEEEALLD
jgi:hypothetical protein